MDTSEEILYFDDGAYRVKEERVYRNYSKKRKTLRR